MIEKNNSIIYWRIIFTYMIAIFHFDNFYHIFNCFHLEDGWYIGVEFFFIVSGFMLYEKIDQYSSSVEYFLHQYKKWFPYYFLSFLVSWIAYCIVNGMSSIAGYISIILDNVFEIFMLHGIGLDKGWNNLNNTTWFISILLICSIILFHCLKNWKDTFLNLVAPLILIVSYSYLYRYHGDLDVVTDISGLYVNEALMRGLADMILGIFSARIYHCLINSAIKKRVICLTGNVCFLFVILGSLISGRSQTDFLFAGILMIAVACGFVNTSISSRSIRYLSHITLCIYLLHDVFRSVIFPNLLGIPESLVMKVVFLGIYLLVVTIAAILLDILVKYMLKGLIYIKNRWCVYN